MLSEDIPGIDPNNRKYINSNSISRLCRFDLDHSSSLNMKLVFWGYKNVFEKIRKLSWNIHQ